MTSIPKPIRDMVRDRAGKRCEYCRKPEGVSQFGHTIDHIRALKHEGSSEPDNLAWACFQCNSTKGSDIASYDNNILKPLFNPRTQSWAEHVEMDGAIIVGRTPEGRVTVRTLQMNHANQLEVRFRLIRSGHW